jgi:ribosomal protein L37AE/L43A
LEDGRWELEIAINVVSRQQWKYVTLIMCLINTPSWRFYSSGIWRCESCNVTHPEVSKEPSAFIFIVLKVVSIYQSAMQLWHKTWNVITTVDRNSDLAWLFVVCFNYKLPLYTSQRRMRSVCMSPSILNLGIRST